MNEIKDSLISAMRLSSFLFVLAFAVACEEEEKPLLPGLPMSVVSVKLQKSHRTNSETILANGVNAIKLEIVFLDAANYPVNVDDHELEVWVNKKLKLAPPYIFTTSQPGTYTFSLHTRDGSVYSDNLFSVSALSMPELPRYRLPVVVHYFNKEEQPLTDAQELAVATMVADTLTIVNNAYSNSRGSDDPNALDSGVEFYLATDDPFGGQLKYPGIEFVEAPEMTLDWTDIEAHVNAGHYWTPSRYMNVWIVDMDFGGAFAFYPEYDATESGYPEGFFGVFVSKASFESAYLGFTLTHEFGHMLNLKHVFGLSCLESDECDDTWSYLRSSEGIYNGREVIRTSCDYQLFAATNYMDYAVSEWNTFTFRQVLRMHNALLKSPFLPTARNINSSGRQYISAFNSPETSIEIKDPVIN